MIDPNAISANAALASAIISLGALIVSILGFVRSTRAAKDAQTAREDATTAQWKMSEHLQVIAEAQAELAKAIAGRMAAGVEGGRPLEPTRVGARLSARLIGGRGSDRLRVANVGIEKAEVIELEVEPDVLVQGGPDIKGVVLEPGEDFTLIAPISMGDSLPLAVRMRWRDSNGEHERLQKVTWS